MPTIIIHLYTVHYNALRYNTLQYIEYFHFFFQDPLRKKKLETKKKKVIDLTTIRNDKTQSSDSENDIFETLTEKRKRLRPYKYKSVHPYNKIFKVIII